MKKLLAFAVLSLMTLVLTSCENEEEQFYVTYMVDGSSQKLTTLGSSCNFYVNGMNVNLPYMLKAGPVQPGYKCGLDVKMTGKNTEASYTAIIKVNGRVVAQGSESIYASGDEPEEKTTHLEYVIGK